MKKKVLTLLGALAALGLAACDPAAPASSAPASNPASSQPAASSKPAESSKPASSKPASSTPASSSQPAVETDPFKKATGHSVKNYQDVPGDTEKGTAAYKMGLCDDNDGFSAIRVNQSAVTYPSGSKRKDGTPEGYTKLDGNGQKMTFKIEVDKGYTGKLYLFGVMDNWSSNTGSSFFYNGAPNTKIEVNGVSIDCSAQNGKTYLDYFGDGQGEGTLSPEGYAEFGSCTLKPGVNEIVYTRVATLNMLVKDFVFVGEEAQEWSAPVEVAADATAGTVAYKKYTNNFDGSVKIGVLIGDDRKSDIAFPEGHWAGQLVAPCRLVLTVEGGSAREIHRPRNRRGKVVHLKLRTGRDIDLVLRSGERCVVFDKQRAAVYVDGHGFVAGGDGD